MLKLILPPSLQEEISIISASKASVSAMFWGGLLEDNQNISDVTVLPLLSEVNIEEVLSNQPYSFDVIIGFAKASQSLERIREFCDDSGLYFLHVSPEQKKKSSQASKKKSPPKKVLPAESLEEPPFVAKAEPDPIEPIPPLSLALDTKKMRDLFTHLENSPIKRRPQQIHMIKMILDALDSNTHLIVEASTGTGKSLAYLLPSILLAEQTQERILIATHTKTLQTQLLEKDVPLALSLLDSKLQVKVAKGKSNYLCLQRFWEYKNQILQKESDLFIPFKELQEKLEQLDNWLTETQNGDLDTLPSELRVFRRNICLQSELCEKKTCSFLPRCFYYKEWEQLNKTPIIILNHALLLSQMDFQYREIDYDLIPPGTRLLIDEAHHFPDNALRESSFSSGDFFFVLESLSSSKDHKGILPYLSKTLKKASWNENHQTLFKYLEDLPLLITGFSESLNRFFAQFTSFFETFSTKRITQQDNPFLSLQEIWGKTKDSGHSVLYNLREIFQNLQDVPEDFREEHSVMIAQIYFSYSKLEMGAELWDHLFQNIPISLALWIDSYSSGYVLHMVDTQIENFLQKTLWENYHSVILTSATLSHQRSLMGLQEKVCIPDHLSLKKAILPPIFDYNEHARFFIPSDIPDPSEENFLLSVLPFILGLVQSTNSGVLILATSLKHMQEIRDFLHPLIDRPLLLQGENPTEKILKEAQSTQNAVIIGVDSFWEGIDLPGKALELLIILKLPFPQPGNPLVETLCEVEKEAGQHPFKRVLLSRAITRLQQGIGRLLRTPEDRGVIVCLDNRIIKKSYGKEIISSLSIAPQFLSHSTILEKTLQFLKYVS